MPFPKQTGYLFLPREIRDMIMDLALHPEYVYVSTNSSSHVD